MFYRALFRKVRHLFFYFGGKGIAHSVVYPCIRRACCRTSVRALLIYEVLRTLYWSEARVRKPVENAG